MAHQSTQIIVALVTALAQSGAWTSTSDLADLLPDVGRATLARHLDELARRDWVLCRQRRGVDYWMGGPDLQAVGLAWRSTWIVQANGALELLEAQLSGKLLSWPAPRVPSLPAVSTLSGEPAHQGAATVCDLLLVLANVAGHASLTALVGVLDVHRQTLVEILLTLEGHEWVSTDKDAGWTLDTRFPALCLSPAIRLAARVRDGQARLNGTLDALRLPQS